MGLIPDFIKKAPGALVDTAKNAERKAKHGFETVVDAGGGAVHRAGEGLGIARDVAGGTLGVGKHLLENPPSPGQTVRVLSGLALSSVKGGKVAIHGKQKPYLKLEERHPEAVAAARKAGEGQRVSQPFITGDRAGRNSNEPVNFVVTGSLDKLKETLKSQGWKVAPPGTPIELAKMAGKVFLGTDKNTNGPVSPAYIDGKQEVIAFNKNDDFNAARDHMRVYPSTPDPETGEPRWQIAATRDVAMTIDSPVDLNIKKKLEDGFQLSDLNPFKKPKAPSHESEKTVDRERDYIMNDFLASGRIRDWAIVDGERAGGPGKKNADGTYDLHTGYSTDGKVYTFRLE